MAAEKNPSRKYDGLKLGWLRAFKAFLRLLVIVFVLFRFVIGISFVKGDSMYPTLRSGQPVFYTRFTRSFEPGDIVSVRVPSGEYFVKRVIAVEGDTLDLRDGCLFINGSLCHEPYALGLTAREPGAVDYPCTLEENQVFVMGDNREHSVDSRSFGPVSERQLKGKLWFVR